MLSQLGPFGTGPTFPVDLRSDRPDGPRIDRVEPLRGGRATADLPGLPDRASDRAWEVARANRPDQRDGTADAAPNTVPLIPPDPNAPAGPPPAFEASILDRARAALSAAPELDPLPSPAQPSDLRAILSGGDDTFLAEPAEDAVPDQAPPAIVEADLPDPYATPPSADLRAAGDIATLRRLETPYDTTTVDVSR